MSPLRSGSEHGSDGDFAEAAKAETSEEDDDDDDDDDESSTSEEGGGGPRYRGGKLVISPECDPTNPDPEMDLDKNYLSMPLLGLPAFLTPDARLTLSKKKSSRVGFVLVCDGAFSLSVPAIYKPLIIKAYQSEARRYFAPHSDDQNLMQNTQRTNGQELLDVLHKAEFELSYQGADGANPAHMQVIFEEFGMKADLALYEQAFKKLQRRKWKKPPA